jgi:serine/threonine-protein kinase
MKFLSALKAERCITQLLAEPDAGTPDARRALDSLRGLGPDAIPKLVDALASADREHTAALVSTLASLAADRTLPQFAAGLSHDNRQAIAGVARALAIGRDFDPNKLLAMLGQEAVSKPALMEVLTAHRRRLNPRELLRRAYDLEPREKAAVFRILGEIATPDLVPDLLSRVEGRDSAARLNIIELLGRFNQPEVAAALERQLKDRNKQVRKAALEALASMPGERDLALLCSLLADPELDVQARAVEVVTGLRHPDTIKHLLPALRDESEFARRSAVEVLNEIAEPDSIKYLLSALEDGDWWVRSRASDALAKIGGPKVMDAVLQLVGDKNENIRRSAVEILNQTRDERAVNHLIAATRDSDWWVRERAADALAELRHAAAVPALLSMLEGDPRSIPAALRALARTADAEVLPKVIPLLERAEKELRIEALHTIGRLANARTAEGFRDRLQAFTTGADEDLAKAATDALARIDSIDSTGTPADLAGAPGITDMPPTATADGRAPPVIGPTIATPVLLDITTLNKGDLIGGRYRYVEKIGKGAFGTVVLVEDEVVGENLILKFLNPNVSSDDEMLKRFVHELRYSRKITHRNVIRIFDFVSLGGIYAISMEYFPSHTLGAELADHKPLPFDKACRWGQDIATGMAVAHQVGIIHRDLKPANILINDEGLLKIVDFGVAAAASSGDTQLTKTGYVIGSPKYMAPEQILGKAIDHRADIYSIGVILYEMLTGVPPYTRGDHMSVMYQHVQGKAKLCEELNPAIPKPLAAIVRRAMEVDKLKRFDSMDALREALEQAI